MIHQKKGGTFVDAQQKFARMMRKRRLEMGITQEKLAEFVGISTTYCRKIEKGKYSPTWHIWLRICTVLNLDMAEIEKIVFDDLER